VVPSFFGREIVRIGALVAKRKQLVGRLREYCQAILTAAGRGRIDGRQGVG